VGFKGRQAAKLAMNKKQGAPSLTSRLPSSQNPAPVQSVKLRIGAIHAMEDFGNKCAEWTMDDGIL
jgi:hypothetical protein